MTGAVTIENGGRLSPGNGVGTINMGGLTLNNTTVWLGNATGTTYGQMFFDSYKETQSQLVKYRFVLQAAVRKDGEVISQPRFQVGVAVELREPLPRLGGQIHVVRHDRGLFELQGTQHPLATIHDLPQTFWARTRNCRPKIGHSSGRRR